MNAGKRSPGDLQARLYEFPYHWLPQHKNGTWSLGRDLRWGFEYLATLEAVTQVILMQGPSSVLDFGCGDGRLVANLLDLGVDAVTGVDLNNSATDFARGFTQRWGERATIVSGDVSAILGKFDCVVAMEVLEHIPSDQLPGVIQALREKCISGGTLVVSVPTTNVSLNPKHERHYDLPLLTAHLAPHFTVDTVAWFHRQGRADRWLRIVTVNRWFALRHPRLLQLITSAYRRSVLSADARDGAHLLVTARPV